MSLQNTIEYPEDTHMPIWRYMSFGKFMDILSTQAIFFTRADKFFDKYEGYVNQDIHDRVNSIFSEYPNPDEMRKEFQELISNLKKIAMINCWNMSYTDSLAMWKTYCPGTESVAIKSNTEKLKNSLWKYDQDSVHIRPVKYVDVEMEQEYHLNGINLFTFKRPQFSFENELRVIILLMNEPKILTNEYDNHKEYTMKLPEFGKRIHIDFDELVEEIYVSPFSPSWFVELVNRLVSLLFKIPIKQSSINKVPDIGFR